MTKTLFHDYNNNDLDTIITSLDQQYYTFLESHCDAATNLCLKLKEHDTLNNTAVYTQLAIAILSEVKHQCKQRKSRLMPYVFQLIEKKKNNHDCKVCAGGCKMTHTQYILELEDSHIKIREMIHRLHRVALPTSNELGISAEYQSLRKALLLIETTLTELFCLEEVLLIQKIIDAQSSINATNH